MVSAVESRRMNWVTRLASLILWIGQSGAGPSGLLWYTLVGEVQCGEGRMACG